MSGGGSLLRIKIMESILKVGRTITGGVSRAAGAVARGARRILASVPLLGLAAPVNPHEPAPTETFTVWIPNFNTN